MSISIPFIMELRSRKPKQHKAEITHILTTIRGRRALKIITQSANGKGSITLFLTPRPPLELRRSKALKRSATKSDTPPCLHDRGSAPSGDEESMDWVKDAGSDSEMSGAQMSVGRKVDMLITAAGGDEMDVDTVETDLDLTSINADNDVEVDIKMEEVDDDEADHKMDESR